VTPEGNEITGYDQPGELLVKSPAVVLGYLNNDRANRETFQDGYMRTGDEAVIRKSPSGNEHIFIVDRIKELIKVKVSIKAFSTADTHSPYIGPPSCACRVGSASFDAPGSQ
jgi:non-ribosomal peptide synthetase component E (peptide arylation enzyme)